MIKRIESFGTAAVYIPIWLLGSVVGWAVGWEVRGLLVGEPSGWGISLYVVGLALLLSWSDPSPIFKYVIAGGYAFGMLTLGLIGERQMRARFWWILGIMAVGGLLLGLLAFTLHPSECC